jgi:hypothetical protein
MIRERLERLSSGSRHRVLARGAMGFSFSARLPAPAESHRLHRAAIRMIESSAGTNIMPERLTEILRAVSEPGWSHAVGHRFV